MVLSKEEKIFDFDVDSVQEKKVTYCRITSFQITFAPPVKKETRPEAEERTPDETRLETPPATPGEKVRGPAREQQVKFDNSYDETTDPMWLAYIDPNKGDHTVPKKTYGELERELQYKDGVIRSLEAENEHLKIALRKLSKDALDAVNSY